MLYAFNKQLIRYRAWIISEPQAKVILESLLKWCYYYTAGRNEQRLSLWSELLSSTHRLLRLAHRLLLSSHVTDEPPRVVITAPHVEGGRLRLLLTVLDYVLVFVELFVARVYGASARRTFVLLAQMFKTCAQLLLLHVSSCGLLSSCGVQLHELRPVEPTQSAGAVTDSQCVVNVLPSTGRLIRSVYCERTAERDSLCGPPGDAVHVPLDCGRRRRFILSRRHLLAETLYQLRPLCHLVAEFSSVPRAVVVSGDAVGCDGVVGRSASGSSMMRHLWLLPLALELASLQLHSSLDRRRLCLTARSHVSSRRLALLLYLLRSPLYERHVQRRLAVILSALGRHLPWGNQLTAALIQYIDEWRQLHFAMWS